MRLLVPIGEKDPLMAVIGPDSMTSLLTVPSKMDPRFREDDILGDLVGGSGGIGFGKLSGLFDKRRPIAVIPVETGIHAF